MKIVNDNLVTDAFGAWPSFHDAEILNIELKRGVGKERRSNLTVCTNCYIVKLTNQESVRPVTSRDLDFAITFEFHQVADLEISGFNHQNVIDDMVIAKESGRFRVTFQAIFGVRLEFCCEGIKVHSVVPMEEYVALN